MQIKLVSKVAFKVAHPSEVETALLVRETGFPSGV